MRKIIIDAFKSSELKYNLEEIIAVDDKIPVEEIPVEEIVREARYVLDKFTGGLGFEQEDEYNGSCGAEQQKWARKEVATLRRFLKKYGQPA